MDTLSHLVLGAAIGEAMLGKKIGKKAMLWGALVNNLPDIDVVFTPLFHPVDALLFHRGITHSFLFVILVTPLLGWLFSRSYSLSESEGKGKNFKSWTWFVFICLLAHPLLDSCTMYGTGIFEPFSNYRAQFTSLFIIEPLYTLPLLISFIALVILKKDSIKRKFWVVFGLSLSTFYLLFAMCNKLYVGKIFTDSLAKQNIPVKEYITSTTPLKNILWNILAKDEKGSWVGFYSHFDKTKDVQFYFIPRNDSLAGNLINNQAVQKIFRFSEGYYCFTFHDGMLYINDLRFAFAGEFDKEAKDFVFSFGIKRS